MSPTDAVTDRLLRGGIPASLAGARVILWGAGRHGGGLAAAHHCTREGAKVSILDRRAPRELPEVMAEAAINGWTWHLGEHRHPAWRRADLIVASPAIPPRALAALPANSPPVVGADALFFARHRGPRIAITGTKGKSTTAAITGELLDWQVGGNSYVPLLDLLHRHGPDLPVVCELSSFQLWYLRQQQPQMSAVGITNIHTDHLDWHPDAEHYRRCKLALLGWSDAIAVHDDLAEQAGDRRLPTVRLDDGGNFVTPDGTLIAKRSQLPLPGNHNARNACIALTLALHARLDPGIAGIRLTAVNPLPHRLQTVHRAPPFTYIDDSIATTPEATLAGLSTVEGPLAVILGGADKGGDFTELAGAMRERGAKAVCLGQTAQHLEHCLAAHGILAPVVKNLPDAIKQAVTLLGPEGGTVLLSPACASTDMFTDFAARGDAFAEAVNDRHQV